MPARFDLERHFTMLYSAVHPRAARRFGDDAVNTAALRVWVHFSTLPTKELTSLFSNGGQDAVRYLWRSTWHAFLELSRREKRQPMSESMFMRDESDRDALDRFQSDSAADVAVTALALADLHRAYRRSAEQLRRGMLLRLGKEMRGLTVDALQRPDTIHALVTANDFSVAAAWYYGARDVAWLVPSSHRSDGTWASSGSIAGLLVQADNVILDTLGFPPRIAAKRSRNVD